jgi:hypothetical protein
MESSRVRVAIGPQERKSGVHYAVTADGIELPIVDVTHPAFALSVGPDEQRALADQFMRQPAPLGRLPPVLRRLALRLFLRGSVLARAIRGAQGTYLGGIGTYLLKLGPDNLPRALAKPVDRHIAASLPAMMVRLRVQDMAQLLADALAPALAAAPGRPLRLLDIAGGTAIGAINALLVLRARQPALLDGRAIGLEVLDLDRDGPAFGARALAALSAAGAPLAGLAVELRHTPYDWARAADLGPVLDQTRAGGAVVAAASEGGLFEYGSDEAIVANLKALHGGARFVAGSVTRAGPLIQRLRLDSHAATRPRGLDVFRALVGPAGWTVARAVERLFSDQVLLAPSG